MSEEGKRVKAYDVVTGKRVTSLGGDRIQEEIDAEEEDLAREARRLRLEEIVTKRRKKIQEIQDSPEAGSNPSGDVGFARNFVTALIQDPKVQKQWLEITDDQRATIIQSVSMLMASSNMSASGGSNVALMLPLMMSTVRSNPGMDAKGLVELIKAVSPPAQSQITLEGIAELINATKTPVQQTQASDTLYDKFVKPALDEMKAMREELAKERMERLEKEISELKLRPGFTEELIHKKDEIETLRSLFGGGGEGANVEIEKMRIDHDRWKAEQEWGMEKWKMEQGIARETEREKWQTVRKMVSPALKRAGPLIDSAINKGQEKIQMMGTQQVPAKVVEVTASAKAFPCTQCGNPIPLSGPPFPDELVCDKCGAKFPKVKE